MIYTDKHNPTKLEIADAIMRSEILHLSRPKTPSDSPLNALEEALCTMVAAYENLVALLVEPTEEMLNAYWRSCGESKEMRPRTIAQGKYFWKAMVSPLMPNLVVEKADAAA